MNKSLKIYCAGAIRGEVFDRRYFDKIIEIVKEFGDPKTEKRGYTLYSMEYYSHIRNTRSIEKLVADRDRNWIRQCKAVIAEISGPSTGTGWEICYATRVRRKPTLCLYHEDSAPSLMITQDTSDYTIIQTYSEDKEFKTCVRCFLAAVERLDKIDEIRKVYFRCLELADLDSDLKKIKELVDSAIKHPYEPSDIQGVWKRDIDQEFVLVSAEVNADFDNHDYLRQFLFRNLILQKKWEQLRSQEIGVTFISGRKSRIIKVLASLEVPTNLLQVYRREGKDKIQYSREAFTKNVRAFRRIGLLKMRSLVVATQHLKHLSKYVAKFGSKRLIDFLLRSREEDWYFEIPDVQIRNIDKIMLSDFDQEEWVQKILDSLYIECQTFSKAVSDNC